MVPGVRFNDQWQGRCFICPEIYEPYRTDKLLCDKCLPSYKHKQPPIKFFEDVSKPELFFGTILPEVKGLDETKLHWGFKDVFLSGDKEEKNAEPREFLKSVFKNPLSLPCGQPSFLPAPALAEFSGLGGVWVLDMSPYIWSGTHKDLRSWAILSTAIEHEIKHLALWTAGNAGLSLAKMVHRYNAGVNETDKRQVYCFVDSSAPPEIVVALRALRCSVAPIAIGKGAILSNDHLFNVVSALSGGKVKHERYWQVTDGWDGMGTFIYSLLAQQSFYLLQSKVKENENLKDADVYIVLPVGTGNLLLGFVRAMERAEKSGGKRTKLVGVLPYGDNVIKPFSQDPEKTGNGFPDTPEAPKLTGFYSPLSPCLWHLLQDRTFSHNGSVEFMRVDRASQVEAASQVLSLSHPIIAAEPSALLAFGALKNLYQQIVNNGRDPSKSVALVVNSGFGIMEIKEQEFYTKSIFAFR